MSTATPAPRSGRRFWTVVALFAAANAAAWVAVDRHLTAAHRGGLHVVAFEPGDGVAVDPHAVVRWRFDADVAPPAGPPGTTSPTVAGRWAWESPRTLAFTPAVDLPRATPVLFTLSTDALHSTGGGALPAPYVARVRPAPLAVRSVRQSAALDDTFVIDLTFSDRVTPADVVAHLTVTDPAGRPVGCRPYGLAVGTRVRVQTDTLPTMADGAELSLTVSPGLTGAAGPLGLDAPFTTTVPLSRQLTATALTANVPTRGKPQLTLSFSGPVDAAALRPVLSVDPPVPFTVESEGQSVALSGDFKSGVRYAVTLAAAATTEERKRLPRPGTLSAFVPDAGADCWLDAEQGYLSTAGGRTVLAHVVNVDQLRVTAARVYDDNLVAWRNGSRRYDRSADVDRYGRPAVDRTVDCPGPKNACRDVPLRLDELIPPDAAHTGAWRITVRPADGSSLGESTVITLSDVALTAKRTADGLLAWATSLRSARPLAAVRVRAYSDKNQLLGSAVTDADGLARLDGLHPAAGETVAVLLADAAAADLTWLDLRRSAWASGDLDTAGRPYLRDGHAAFVYADRGVYRPGETVRLRAIVRGPGDVAPTAPFPVRWRFRRPDLHDWRTVPAMLDADGSTAVDVPLPTDLPTGEWSVDLGLSGDDARPFGAATFAVEEFVPNRLRVTVTTAAERTTVGPDPLPIDVQADYLFGRPAAGLPLSVSTHAMPVPFAPAGWAGWTFGDAADIRPDVTPTAHHSQPTASIDALDATGHARPTVDVADVLHAGDDPAHAAGYRGPWRLAVAAAVREAGGRAVTVGRSVDVDAVPAYVGLSPVGSDPPKPGVGRPVKLRLVRPDGTVAVEPCDLSVRLLRVTWNTVTAVHDGRYTYDCTRVLTPVQVGTVHVDGDHEGVWNPVPPTAGRYAIEAADGSGGAVTTAGFYAADAVGWADSADSSHPDRLDVRVLGPGEPDVPAADARSRPAAVPLKVGDTARVLVSAPFAGRLLLTVETDAVLHSTVVDMPASHVAVPVPVTAACRPGAFVTATVIRPVAADVAGRPFRAFGVARLSVDSADRKLTVALATPTEIRPTTSLDVGLTVTDAAGRPVANAAVAVTAVDEGVCSLTDFATPDPLAFFTARRALGVTSADTYGALMPETARADVGGDSSRADESTDKAAPPLGTARHRSPIGGVRVRPVALGWVTAHTDAAGHARAAFPVPPFQGQLRVMAVAHTADKVGSADGHVTVRSPLLAQSSWPRFAAPGDRFTVPVVVFDNRLAGGTAHVTVQSGGDGLLTLDRAATTLAIPGGGQRRADLAVVVGQRVGVARVRLLVEMNGDTYAEDVELPVRPAAAMTGVGGVVRGSTTRPVAIAGLLPMLPGTGSVQVDVTPWPTLNLPAGLDYLDRYPYGCAEQTTSRLFPLVALGEIGRKIDPVHFDPAHVRDEVDQGVTRLIGMQTADGGLAMWPGEAEAWPWGSVYAAHFLTVARANGIAVPDDFYDELMRYVRHQLDAGTDWPDVVEVQAYAAYVLAMAGRPDRAAMGRLGELATTSHTAPADARLFLSAAWVLAGRPDVADGLLPAAAPPDRPQRQLGGNLGSAVRDRAVMVLAVEQVQPDRADLPDLVQGLADLGRDGGWASTQDAAFASLAIGQYLRAEAGRHPTAYTAATLRVGDAVLATAGGDPLSWSGEATGPLLVRLDGPAAAVGHVAWLQDGVPLTPPPAVTHGLAVRRRYVSPDGRDLPAAVHSGDLVRVLLDIDGPADLPNVVLDDLLPAGLEVENGRLATAAQDDRPTAADEPPPFGDHVDIRDDRVVVVGRIGPGGHARATYLARAVTPGTFVVPSARAEAMYDLNVNGSSDAGRLTVVGESTDVARAE